MKKTETVYQMSTTATNRRVGTLLGVRLMTSNSTANRKETTITRTLPSHDNHARSLTFASLIQVAQAWRRTRLEPGPVLSHSVRQFGDQGEQRQIERNHDSADDYTQEPDQHRLHQGQQVLGSSVHFVFVKISDLLQHGIHGAG